MTDTERREAARQFINKWNGKGKEDEDARSYWIDILVNILGMDKVTDRVHFEKKVAGDKSKKRIDVYIPETHVLIEQKSLGIALDKPQVGHDGKTPYEQAKEYDNLLPYDEKARWIITCNFSDIWIYDMSIMQPEPLKLQLVDLQNKYTLLDFLIEPEVKEISNEIELSIKAGELVGKIHDRFLTQYNDPLAKRTQRSLNILCVRLVFCLYAEDAGLFSIPDAFKKYIGQYEPKDIRNALIELFRVLDTPIDERADLYLSDELAAFPYVNGGLFQDENIVIPRITEDIKEVLLQSAEFDWSDISPTIFGAVFESTLNPETRRKGGMHYTSIENIHKVIDPLFLDDLWDELHEIEKIAVPATQKKKLNALQDKIAGLKFLDPACGSGNFLTESYLSLRRIENEILKLKVALDKKTMTGQISFGLTEDTKIKVSINQFYGIEINDFACKVAQSALWIAESQMLKETEAVMCVIVGFSYMERDNKIIWESDNKKPAQHINGYLFDGPDVFIKNRSKSINAGTVKVVQGSPPADDGRLILSAQEKEEWLKKYPELSAVIHPLTGSREFINDITFTRYCFWFEDHSPAEFQHIPELMERFSYIHDYRLASPVPRIQKTADKPYLFTQNRQPKSDYLIIPRVSSSSRRYIPMRVLQFR